MAGRLIDKAKLERNRQARARRRARIVDAARHCFRHHPLTSVTLDTVDQRARVRDGLSSMFFGSVEELFLTVLKGDLDEWYRALHGELERSSEALAPAELASLLSDSLRNRETLARMLALASVMLEGVVDSPAALIYLRSLRDWTDRVGTAIEARHARFAEGDGGRLMGCVHVMVAGLEPALRPVGVIGPGLGKVEDGRQLDFHRELERMLRQLLEGWCGGEGR
jgi:AcrR family transcriptional regulator